MFGSVDIKTRPIKLAYLVDPNNAKQVRESIRISSTLWGGAYFPIISLYKRMPATWREKPFKTPPAKDVILGNIEAFDPDILVQLSNDVPSFVTETGLEIIKPEDIWNLLDEEEKISPRFGLGVFELLNDIYKEFFKYKVKYPIKLVIPKIPHQLSLFWASFFGEIPSKLLPFLEKNYFEPLEIEVLDFKVDNLQNILTDDVLFPRRITQLKTNKLNRSDRRKDANVFYMDATKIEDIIDFWNLRALGRQVIPVPKQLQQNPQLKEIVTEFLKENRRPWRHDPKVCDVASIIRARNSTMAEMQEYAKTLKIERGPYDPSNDPYFSLQHWYPRVWDEWARDKDGAVPDDLYGDEEDSIEIVDIKEFKIRFRPLMPKFAQKYGYHGEPRCANEVSFRLYGPDEFLAEVFPKFTGKNLTHAISGLTSFKGDWRIGRHGLVKLVKEQFNEIRDIPVAQRIVFSWLTDIGWKPKLSAPGILAKQIYKRLDGNPNILRNETLLGLLEHMNGGLVQRDGSSVEKNKISQERDLTVGEVKNRLLASYRGQNLYEYVLSKEIFKLGLRVQCSHCLRNSWFPLESVHDNITCPKCLNIFPAIGNLDDATWSYKTTGPFSVPNYADGAYAVLLTMDLFNELRMTTMRKTPVLSFTAEAPDKKDLEADFALFWQDSIYGEKQDGVLFGECKTYGKFGEKDFERMRYLAKNFPGAVLVFSTLRKSLSQKEIIGITRIAKKGRKYWKAERPVNPVLILTGTELLNWSGPPYCWEDSIRSRFDYIRGLIGLCDATQQIYLNLPSWQVAWDEEWKKRREKKQVRKKPVVTK